MSTNIFEKTADLLREIVTDAFPHDNSRPAYEDGWQEHSAWKPREEANAYQHVIKSTDDVEVGDLVVVKENRKYRGEWQWNVIPSDATIRDIVADWNQYYLYVVTAKTAKRLSYVTVSMPSFWNGYDVPTVEDDRYVETTAAYADARRIVKTGLTMDDLLDRFEAHPKHAEYVKTFAKALARKQADEKKQAAKQAVADKARKAAKDKAKAHNAAIGADLFDLDWSDRVQVTFRKDQIRRLMQEALDRRLEDGLVTREQYDLTTAAIRKTSVNSSVY